MVARRRGVRWRLDIREGIDLAIYLNLYGRAVFKALRAFTRPGMKVVDIGANIGAWTLPLALLVGPTGRVLACEPTAYAFGKLMQNLSLNPELSERVLARQVMLVAMSDQTILASLYSSWPLRHETELQPVMCGALKSTEGAVAWSLDA